MADAVADVSLERQVAAVRDEIALRRRVYPRWVAAGKMTEQVADRRIGEMKAVQATLESLLFERRERDEPQLF